jgi:hypothetical protein
MGIAWGIAATPTGKFRRASAASAKISLAEAGVQLCVERGHPPDNG